MNVFEKAERVLTEDVGDVGATAFPRQPLLIAQKLLYWNASPHLKELTTELVKEIVKDLPL